MYSCGALYPSVIVCATANYAPLDAIPLIRNLKVFQYIRQVGCCAKTRTISLPPLSDSNTPLLFLLLLLSGFCYKTKTAEMFTVISPVRFSCLVSLSYLCLIISVPSQGIGMSLTLFLCILFQICVCQVLCL